MAVLVSGGQTVTTSATGPWSTPLEWTGAGGNAAHPLLDFFKSTRYEDLYICQSSVRKVIDKLVTLQAIVPFKAYQRTDEGRDGAAASEFGRLVRKPTPSMSQWDFRDWMHHTKHIQGIAFAGLVRFGAGGSRVAEVAPLHPMRMRYGKPAGKGPLNESRLTQHERVTGKSWFFVVSESEEVHFPRRDLMIWKNYHPKSDHWGLSKLESLRTELEDDAAAKAAMTSMWKRGARPGYVIKSPDDFSNHSAVVQQIRDDAEAAHGGVGNWWRPLVLDGGADISELRMEEGMEYLGLRKLTDIEVGAQFDLSGPVIHQLERATNNNIFEIFREVYKSTMAYQLGSFEAAWEHDVRDGTHGEDVRPNFPDEFYAEHLTEGVLRGSPEQQIDAASTELQTGQISVNEWRAIQNRPPVEGGDVLLVNSAMVALSSLSGDLDDDPERLAKMAQQLYLSTPEKAVLTTAEARSILNKSGADLAAIVPDLTPPDVVVDEAALGSGAVMSGQAAAAKVHGRLGRVAEVSAIDVDGLVVGLAPGAALQVRQAVQMVLIADGSVAGLRDLVRGLELPE